MKWLLGDKTLETLISFLMPRFRLRPIKICLQVTSRKKTSDAKANTKKDKRSWRRGKKSRRQNPECKKRPGTEKFL